MDGPERLAVPLRARKDKAQSPDYGVGPEIRHPQTGNTRREACPAKPVCPDEGIIAAYGVISESQPRRLGDSATSALGLDDQTHGHLSLGAMLPRQCNLELSVFILSRVSLPLQYRNKPRLTC